MLTVLPCTVAPPPTSAPACNPILTPAPASAVTPWLSATALASTPTLAPTDAPACPSAPCNPTDASASTPA